MKRITVLCSALFIAYGLRAQVEMPLFAMAESQETSVASLERAIETDEERVSPQQEKLFGELAKLQKGEQELISKVERLTRALASIPAGNEDFDQTVWEAQQLERQALEEALMHTHLTLSQQQVLVQRKWQELSSFALANWSE